MLNAIQSALRPAGIQAERIEDHWWVIFWVTLVVTLLVFGYLAVALRRGSGHEQSTVSERGLLMAVAGGIGATVVTLFGVLLADLFVNRAIASQRDDTEMVVEVTAYQWWWNVEYQHPEPEQRVRTANELHLPVGRNVAIKLLASDVIHSFWVPALHGKQDAIPGHSAVLSLRADREGIYRGQCAEYCGLQHAHMALTVIVESSDAFERWLQGQRTTAPEPTSVEARHGLELVQSGACGMCHAIRGTTAGGRTGPDLTHLASRSSLAAGTLPNTREHLASWLQNPQAIKPGTHMPLIALSPNDLQSLLTYLEGLQ